MLIRDTDPKPPKPVVVGLKQIDEHEIRLRVDGFDVINIIQMTDAKVTFGVNRISNHAGMLPFNTDAQGRVYVSGTGVHLAPLPVYSEADYEKRAMEILNAVYADRWPTEAGMAVMRALKQGMK